MRPARSMTMTPVEMFVRIVSMNCHLLGPLGQHLDGNRDLPREIDPHPGGGEHHEEGDQDEGGDVAGPDRVVEEGYWVVFVVRPRYFPDPVHLFRGQGLDRHDGPPVGQEADGGRVRFPDKRHPVFAIAASLLPLQTGADLGGDLPRNVSAPRHDPSGPHHEKGNTGRIPAPRGFQDIHDGNLLPLSEDGGCGPVRYTGQVPGLLLEVSPGNVERAGQGDPDPPPDPRLDAGRGDVGGRDEEEDRGEEGKGDEDEHEAGPDLRAQDVPLPVQNQLEDVPGDEEDQQHDQDDVEVDESEDDDVVRERYRPPERRQVRLQDGEPDHQGGHDPDGDPLPLLLGEVLFRRKPRGPARGFAHGAEMSPFSQSVSTSHNEEKKKIERSGSDSPTLSRRVRTRARYLFPRSISKSSGTTTSYSL